MKILRRLGKMKVAILFPGQGAQHAGMGLELYNYYTETKQIFDQADELLDWNLKEVCFENKNEIINQTRYTQAALFTTNYGIYKALEAGGIKPSCVLGFSLGEYDAIVASGVLGFEETLALVEERAKLMEECAIRYPGGMYAVIGMKRTQVDEICEVVSQRLGSWVSVANDNCEGQVTIAGTKEALEEAAIALKEAGAKRVIPLKVSGAFHSLLMEQAAKELAKKLDDLTFNEPTCPIVSNVTAQFMNAKEVKENIPLQVIKGVRFRESIMNLVAQGFDTFIEVGPKCTLSGLVKKINQTVDVYNIENLETLQNVIEKVGVTHA